MQNLSEETLKKLKCSKCENPLSVPPITYNSEGGFFCGRCSPTPQSSTCRLEIYEILAQYFTFPCQFSKFGCTQMLKWEVVGAHETVCRKRPFLCPVASVMQCLWRGSLTEVVDHMSKRHHCTTKEVNCIKIRVNSTKINVVGWKILLVEGKKYLFCVNFNDETNSLEFGLVQLEYDKKKDTYRFRLFSEDLRKEIRLPTQEVNSYELKRNIEIQKGNSIGQEAINYLLNENGEFYCEIILRPGNSKQDNDKKEASSGSVPTILECPVCYKYMRTPIFQCQTGHSFCFTCTPALKECPMCRGKMLKTRNFALEDIASEYVIDCRNKPLGCDFKGFSSELEDHQAQCKIVCCSVEGCLWNGSELALGEHVKVHEQKIKPLPRSSPQQKPRTPRRTFF